MRCLVESSDAEGHHAALDVDERCADPQPLQSSCRRILQRLEFGDGPVDVDHDYAVIVS